MCCVGDLWCFNFFIVIVTSYAVMNHFITGGTLALYFSLMYD